MAIRRLSLIAAGMALLALLPAAASAASAADRPPRRYVTSAARKADAPLNVHIVCHSHDDAGWLKTVDQYFYGANNSIQVAGVQYILDTVVQALQANPHRKFVYAEMSFFTRWWDQQDDETRAAVAQLVKTGQLDFVNGGYVQHDEAAAHYVAMIDQTTRGHTFLHKTFGVAPRVGWQIDPFGHSSTQAGLLSAKVGFDALFFGRADYQDMAHRLNLTAMEVVWSGSGSLADASVFTGNFPSGNYGPPPGFAYEWGDAPIMDDPRLEGYNVQERVDAFVEVCRQQAGITAGNDIMLTIGSDFQFSNAQLQFKNLDKLIHHANADGRLHAFYSTPAQYAAAKHAYKQRWPLKEDDFFPYADFPHAFWTGYFTSRPASKGYIRAATAFLQAARQLEAFLGLPGKEGGPTTDSLEEAVSLLQHHDSITGTEKQHVANDYHRRLHQGMKEAQEVVTSALEALIRGKEEPSGPSVLAAADGEEAEAAVVSQRRLQAASGRGAEGAGAALAASSSSGGAEPNPVDAPISLEICDWLNITACNTTVRLSAGSQGILVAAYNPLGWSREVAVRVPLNTSATCAWAVTGPEGEAVASQLVGAAASTLGLQELMMLVNATCPRTFGDAELVFVAQLPPLGYSTYFVQPAPAGAASCSRPQAATPSRAAAQQQQQGDKAAVLDNGLVRLEFDTSTGLLASMSAGGVSARLTTHFGWYNASDGLQSDEDRGQGSGAYIFRPNGFYNVTPEESARSPSLWQRLWPMGKGGGQGAVGAKLEIVEGELVSEAWQTFGSWATLVTRLHKGQEHVELEWTVGPIPFEDGLGREVVLVYTSDLDSGNKFWTDSNGREMLKRVRDFRPTWDLNVTEPVAGNYYPLTAAMYIREEGKGGEDGEGRQLALLTDRAQGGSSMRSGQMEVMVHRRCLAEDLRGVGEHLNETACGCRDCDCPGLVVRGRHWLVLAPGDRAARPRRTLQQQLNDPPVLAFAPIPRQIGAAHRSEPGNGRIGLRRTFSLSEGHILHSNVHLLTLKDTGSSYLVRLAHLYQAGEDPALSNPVTENLNAVLQLFHYQEVKELSLSGNQLRADMEKSRLRFEPGDSLSSGTASSSGLSSASGAAVEAADEVELARLRSGAEIIDCSGGCVDGELLVTLQPMEVRTFELVYRPN